MRCFLVGGAVRDKRLDLPVKDRDWVVVGSDPDEMIANGFKAVGRDFPVFIHPTTGEEYALARTERKSGRGYHGFVFHTDQSVTLEEDLKRRDLTINAMAEDETGQLVDPFDGLADLNNRVLRHVSSSFAEDPLRILRAARFAARLHRLGFSIAEETMTLMKSMVTAGEASWLVPERVWQETVRALAEPSPEIYFEILSACGALSVVAPEWSFFLQQNSNRAALVEAAARGFVPVVRYAVSFFPTSDSSQEKLRKQSERMRPPTAFTELAELVCQYGPNCLALLPNPSAESVLTLFENTDALRRPERFDQFLETVRVLVGSHVSADRRAHYREEHIDRLSTLLRYCLHIKAEPILQQGFRGPAVGEQMRQARLEAINRELSQ